MMKFDDPSTWPPRWIDRCEIIATDMEWTAKDGGLPYKKTAMQIFNSSPTGELFQVHRWFVECLAAREFAARKAAGESPHGINTDFGFRVQADHQRQLNDLSSHPAFSKRRI
jgi:hypothetical protein